MPRIKERWAAAQSAVGLRKFVFFGLLLAIFRGLQWVADEFAKSGMNAFAGLPIWYVGSILSVLIVTYWLLDHIVELRRQLKPRLSITFHQDKGSIVTTPLKEKRLVPLGNQQIEIETRERRGVYIRGLVTAESEKTVSECAAYLTGVRKKQPTTGVYTDTQYVDDLQLPWSLIGARTIAIPKGVRRYFDIVLIDEDVMQPRITGVWPLTARKLFDDKTTYQLDLLVDGEGITTRATIEFDWNGDLTKVTGRRIS